MKKAFYTLLLLSLSLIFGGGAVSAQDTGAAKSQPTPLDDDVVKISTNLIQLDVTVTDKNGSPIGDLKLEDFEIFENGTQKTIKFFSFIIPPGSGIIPPGSGAAVSGATLSATENSNNTIRSSMKIEQVGRILAIVVDDFQMPTESVAKVKKNLKTLIQENMQPNDLVAIIKTSGSVGVLQQFTNDKNLLFKIIDDLKYQPLTTGSLSALPPARIGLTQNLVSGLDLADNPAIQKAPTSPLMQAKDPGGAAKETEMNKKGFLETHDNEKLAFAISSEQSANGPLAVLKKVLEGMGNMKGRKSLLFISRGVNQRFSINERDNPLGVTPDKMLQLSGSNTITVAGRSYNVKNIMQLLTELANRNSVSIFTFDPGGAITTNLDATESTQGTIEGLSVNPGDNKIASTPLPRTDSSSTLRSDDIRNRQEGLKELADETGGKVFINNNDLSGALKSVFDAQGAYYLLAYEPDEKTFDAKTSRFNKLEVKVKRPNAKVSQRSGFFNSTQPNSDGQKDGAGKDDGLLKRIFLPYDYSDVKVDLASVYAGTEQNKSTVRSFISVSPNSLTLVKNAENKNVAKFDIIMVAFDQTGRAAGSSARNFTVTFDDKAREGFLKNGLISTVRTELQTAGLYKFRVLVRDNNSGNFGSFTQSVVIPDPEKDGLNFSGVLLQNFTPAELQEAQSNPAAAGAKAAVKMQNDTAYRRFSRGTTLTYAYIAYLMPALAKAGESKVGLTARLLKNDQPFMTLKPEEIVVNPAQGVQKSAFRGGFNLDSSIPPGKYVLQITASAEKSQRTETQSIDFEVLP